MKTCPLQLTLPKFAGARGRATPTRSWPTVRVQDDSRCSKVELRLNLSSHRANGPQKMPEVCRKCAGSVPSWMAFGDKWDLEFFGILWGMGGTQCLMPFLVFSASGSLRKLSQCASMCDLCVGTSEGSKAHCTLEWFGMYGNLVYMQNAEMVYDRIWSKHTQTPSYYPQSRRGTRKMSVEKDQAHFSQLEPPSQRKMAGLRATVPGSKHTSFRTKNCWEPVEILSWSIEKEPLSLLAF